MSEHIVKAPHVPPFVTFVTSAVPMVFDNSLSYYEALCALWKWLQDDVVNVINNNATVTEDYIDLTNEYIEKFNELKEYVDTYFDNLDVQEEINNKLDAMVEDGTLPDIIYTYLNTLVVYGFDSVSAMVASESLSEGSYARTTGYYNPNDGGDALYKIRAREISDVEDHGLIHFIGDDLVAEMIVKDFVTPEQFGAHGDGLTDDTSFITSALACDTVKGILGKTYYVTGSISVNNKNIYDMNIKASPFEVSIGNTYHKLFILTGNNNFYNVKVSSEFEYIPSIEIYADPSSTTGLASNVQAFAVTAGVTNFYECKCDYCWAFHFSNTGAGNVYDFIGTNLEMSLYNESSSKVKVYNSNFTINKTVNSIYYHHIYTIQGTDTEFNNCEFTETGTGNIGNHYHGYSTSFTDDMSVTGKLLINNCKLVTAGDIGQINGVNLYVNGGSVEGSMLLIGGTLVEKPTGYFKDCDILVKYSGNNPISRSKVVIDGCHITCSSTGTKYLCKYAYKIYNSKIDIPLGTFGNQVEADSDHQVTDEIAMYNCIVNAKTMSWCYPYWATNVKIMNSNFNLTDLKATTNPSDRGTVGFMYNCVFSNWTLPFSADGTNTFKYEYIYDGTKVDNIS